MPRKKSSKISLKAIDHQTKNSPFKIKISSKIINSRPIILISQYYKSIESKITEVNRLPFIILIILCIGVLVSETILGNLNYAENQVGYGAGGLAGSCQDEECQQFMQILTDKLNQKVSNMQQSNQQKNETESQPEKAEETSDSSFSNLFKRPYSSTLIIPDSAASKSSIEAQNSNNLSNKPQAQFSQLSPDWNNFNKILAPKGELSQDEYLKLQNLFCPIDDSEDYQEIVNSLIPLDPNRFMVPLLAFNPSSQLRGLREAIFVAIALNRTLVVPTFFEMKTGETQSVIHPHHRIDEHRLRQFISTISGLDFKQITGSNQFDSIFYTRSNSCTDGRIERLKLLCEESLRIDCHNLYNNVENSKAACLNYHPQIPFYPRDLEFLTNSNNQNTVLRYEMSKSTIRRFYGNSFEKTSLIMYPFHSLDILQIINKKHIVLTPDSQVLDLARRNTDMISDNLDLFSKIIQYTSRPKYIRYVAQKFIKEKLKMNSESGAFLAIHWRYDLHDWHKHCMTIDSLVPHCQKIATVINNHQLVAKTWMTLVKALISKGLRLDSVYLATAPVDYESVKKFTAAMQSEVGESVKVVSFERGLSEFADEQFHKCDYYGRNKADIISLLEMEICSQSKVWGC